jgi:hypothetical protein
MSGNNTAAARAAEEIAAEHKASGFLLDAFLTLVPQEGGGTAGQEPDPDYAERVRAATLFLVALDASAEQRWHALGEQGQRPLLHQALTDLTKRYPRASVLVAMLLNNLAVAEYRYDAARKYQRFQRFDEPRPVEELEPWPPEEARSL